MRTKLRVCGIFGRELSHTIVEDSSMKRILFVLACLVLTSAGAMAQPKEESLAIGISTGWHQGAHLNYVISQDFHLGLQLGLHISGSNVDPTIAPHVRCAHMPSSSN